jgi:hypothetical protein
MRNRVAGIQKLTQVIGKPESSVSGHAASAEACIGG